MSNEKFTDAIQALSRLYTHARDTNNASLATRTESATRELLGWHDDQKHDDVREERTNKTLVGLAPKSEEKTR